MPREVPSRCSHVILNAVKNLVPAQRETLRCAKSDARRRSAPKRIFLGMTGQRRTQPAACSTGDLEPNRGCPTGNAFRSYLMIGILERSMVRATAPITTMP